MNVLKRRLLAIMLVSAVLFTGIVLPVEAAGFGSAHPLTWMSRVVRAVEGFVGHLFAPRHTMPAPAQSSSAHHASPPLPQAILPIPPAAVVTQSPPHTADPAPANTLIFCPFANLMLTSKYGDIYPADGLSPALGTITHPYSQINLTHATIDSGGTLTLSGGLTVDGLSNGFLHADKNGTIATVHVDLGKDITATLGVGNGGTGQTSLMANGVLYGNGTAGIAALPPGTAGFVLQSNGTNSAPSWIAASGLTAGNIAFSGITSATNTTAALLVGSGASLDVTGSGTINASSLGGGTWASPGVIGGTTPNAATFSTLTANGNATIGGSTGITLTGSGAGISFSGSGNHTVGAASGALQMGAVTLTGAITGNAQTITGLGTVSLAAGNSYQINGASVLNATTLGSGVVNSSLTSLGTITTGTWNGTSIATAYGGTGATTFTSNGILYGNGAGAVQVTAAGTNGQLLLGVTSGAPAFAMLSGDATITNAGVLTLKNTGTANTYGSASQVPVVTTDTQGRVTGVTNTSIALAASQITSGTLGIARGGTNNTAYTTGSLVYYDGSKLAEDNANLFWDSTNHRLGLGTTAPLAALDVAGSASLSGGLSYRGGGTAHTTSILDGGTYNIQRSLGGSGLSSSLFIDANGNVGIGTAAPGYKLDVSGTANISNTFTQSGGRAFLGNYNAGATAFPRAGTDLAIDWNTCGGCREISLWNTDTGNSTQGSFIFRQLTGTSTETIPMTIYQNGNVTIGGTLTQNSDQRLKTNIQTLPDTDALTALNQLHPVSFNWRQTNQSTATQFGFIAQEVERVFPQLVTTSTSGPTTITLPDGSHETYTDLKTVNYVGLISPLVKAVQELDSTLTLQGQQVSSVAATAVRFAATQRAQTAPDAVSEQSVATPQTSVQSLADRVTALEKQAPVQPSPFSASLSATLTGVGLSLDKDATISGSLTVQGRATLNDLGVTGNITAGVLSMHGLDGTIDAIGNTLKLQSLGIGSIDLLAGKVTVDDTGNIVSQGELTVRKLNIDESDPASASIGNGTLKAGNTSVVISTKAVKAKSRVFLTPEGKTGGQPLEVGGKSDGTSFTVQIEHAYTSDIPFDWWIVN